MRETVSEPPVERQVAPARCAVPSSIDALGTAAAVMALQRSAGNRAVAAAIRSGRIPTRPGLMRAASDTERPGPEPGSLSEPEGGAQLVAQPQPQPSAAAEATTTTTGGDADVKCRIDSFTQKLGPWDVSWPWTWTTGAGQNTTLRLPSKFNLVLSKGCKKEDCTIGQRKKGETLGGGDKNSWPNFIADGDHFWWNGANWSIATGSWSKWPGRDEAEFTDSPGFQKVPNSYYPLYWGGVGGKDCFVFETWVADKATGKELKSIGWNMRIDYKRPEDGSHGSCQ